MPKASVIIPNWNGERLLRLCLPSLRRQTFKDFETIIVDNGSTDDSIELVEKKFPEARLIALPENRGFAAAVNAGIKASASEFAILLNNDTEQDEGWLESLVQAAEEHPESVGFFASKLLDFHDRAILDGAGDALRLSGLPYRLGHGEKDAGQFDEPSPVFGACAAAAMYRKSMLDEIGLFDEDFVSYCEDGDLSFRAHLMGYGCVYVPSAVVFHMGSASTGGKRSADATRLGTRNSIWLLAKNLPLATAPHILPFFILGQATRLATTAATGTLKAHLKGLAEAKRLLPPMIKKRRAIQSKRRVPDSETRQILRDSSLAATASIARRIRGRLRKQLDRILG